MKLLYLFIFLLGAQSCLSGAALAVGKWHPVMLVWPFLTFFFVCLMAYSLCERRFWEGKLEAAKEIEGIIVEARSRKG